MGFLRVTSLDMSMAVGGSIICADFVTNATLAVIWNKAIEMERSFGFLNI